MKGYYRGYEIIAERNQSLGGKELLYFSVFRIRDGYECFSSFEDSSETEINKFNQLKEQVDAEYLESDPWMEFSEKK